MKKKTLGRRVSTILLVLVLVVGMGLLIYPLFSEYWNSFHQSRAIISYAEKVANLDKEKYEQIWNAALEYNRLLSEKSNHWAMDEEAAEDLIRKEQAQELGLIQQEKPVQKAQTGEQGEKIIVSIKTESVVLDISPTRKGGSAEKGQIYETAVSLENNPIQLVSKEDAALGEVKAYHIQVFHIVDGEAVEVPVKDVVIKDGMLLGFTITTDGFSPYLVKCTVDFVLQLAKAELNLNFDGYVLFSSGDAEIVHENAEGVTVVDIEGFADSAAVRGEQAALCGVGYGVSLQGATKMSDFDKSFFENAAVSVEGKGVPDRADQQLCEAGKACRARKGRWFLLSLL